MFEGLHEKILSATVLGQMSVLERKLQQAAYNQKHSVEMSFDRLLTQEKINELDVELVTTEFLGLIDDKYSYKFTF